MGNCQKCWYCFYCLAKVSDSRGRTQGQTVKEKGLQIILKGVKMGCFTQKWKFCCCLFFHQPIESGVKILDFKASSGWSNSHITQTISRGILKLCLRGSSYLDFALPIQKWIKDGAWVELRWDCLYVPIKRASLKLSTCFWVYTRGTHMLLAV